MRPSLIGRFLALFAAVALIISGALPPLHIHQESSALPLEHWHFAEHAHPAETVPVFDDDDHDGPAHFLDNSGLPAAPTQQVAPGAVLNAVQILVVDPLDASIGLAPSWLTPPSQGPPPSPGLLRAPPFLA